MKNINQQLQYIFHIILTNKYKYFINIFIILIIYLFINENNVTYCMMENTESTNIGEIKNTDIIEDLRNQNLHLSQEISHQQQEINTISRNLDICRRELQELRQENQQLKDEILRLEIIVREQYVPKCNIM